MDTETVGTLSPGKPEELAERLTRVVGPGGEDEAVPHHDALLDRTPLDVQGTRLLSPRDPLKDVGEGHRLEVAGEAH